MLWLKKSIRPGLRVACLLTLAAQGVALAQPARDAEYPQRQVRIVVPFAASGANDILARLFALKLTERWKRQVVVENRPGAGSNIGMEVVAKSTPDGYTMLFIGSSYVLNPSLFKKLPFDPVKDFERVAIVATAPNLLLVNSSVPARTVKELVSLVKGAPGKLNYASSGNGSNGHISMEVFKHMSGSKIEHIPYNGAGDAVNALLAGHVQMIFTAPGSIAQHIKTGRVVPIGVTSLARLTGYPEIPTISEAGLPGFDVSSVFGVLVPGQTPKHIIQRINGELLQVLKYADVRERIASLSFEPVGSSPEEYTASVMADLEKYARVVKAAGIQPE